MHLKLQNRCYCSFTSCYNYRKYVSKERICFRWMLQHPVFFMILNILVKGRLGFWSRVRWWATSPNETKYLLNLIMIWVIKLSLTTDWMEIWEEKDESEYPTSELTINWLLFLASLPKEFKVSLLGYNMLKVEIYCKIKSAKIQVWSKGQPTSKNLDQH